jgi:hypothetical protein
MAKPKSKVHSRDYLARFHAALEGEFEIDELTQQVEPPLLMKELPDEEPTLVGLDVEELAKVL